MRKVFITAVVLVGAVIALGIHLGWFSFSARSSPDNDKISLGVEINKAKAKEDVQAAKEKAKEFGDKVKEIADALVRTETVKGTIVSLAEGDRRFEVKTSDEKEVTIYVEPSAKVRLKDKRLELKDLRTGDQVAVVCQVKDGKHTAQSITVERGT